MKPSRVSSGSYVYSQTHDSFALQGELVAGYELMRDEPTQLFFEASLVLPVDKIDYVEAQDDYVSFKSAGKEYLKDQTMNAVEASLDPTRFVRIHRSYLLNIERIARVELYAKDSRVAILRDGRRLPVSRAGYARLSKLL